MASKATAGRLKGILAFLLLFGPAFLLVFIGTRGCDHKFKELDDFGAAVDYKFTDPSGKKYSSKDFEGQIVLITTLQETCPENCSISFWQLNQAIYQHIRKNKNKKLKQVKIISFVTDGEGNPVEDLSVLQKAMTDHVEGYDPEIWLLAAGSAREIYDFERNNESLLKEGDEFYGGQAYQELILLLDKENHLRMVLSGTSEGMIRRMKEHVALLHKQYIKESANKKK